MAKVDQVRSTRVNKLAADSDALLSSIGVAIREKRLAQGISQRTLANISDVSKSFIHEIETGTANPTWQSLAQLCQELDVSLADLVIEACMSNIPGFVLSDEALRKVAAYASGIETMAARMRQ